VVDKVKKAFTGKEEPIEEEVPKIMVDRFFVNRISFPRGDFIYDPESTNGLKGARWCAEKVIEPLEDVKSRANFKNTGELKSNATLKEDLVKMTGEEQKDAPDTDRVEYFRYWEKNRYGVVDKCIAIVPDQDIILYTGKNPYDHRDWPFEEVTLYDIPDYLFSMGDIEPLDQQQQLLDKSESIMFMHLKRFLQKYKLKKGAVDAKAREALQSPQNTGIELEEMNDIQALENPSVNQTVPLATDTVKGDMTQIAGNSEYDRAALPEKNRTLGEAQLVQMGSQLRSDEARRNIDKFLKRVGRKLMQVVQQYMTEEMMLQISGDGTGEKDFLKIDSEQLQGEFDLEIEPYSAAPLSREYVKKQSLDLYNLLIKDTDLTYVARNELRRNVLEAFEYKNVDVFTISLPPPSDESMGGGAMGGGAIPAGVRPPMNSNTGAPVVSRDMMRQPPPSPMNIRGG
jgi:hypothetical protein